MPDTESNILLVPLLAGLGGVLGAAIGPYFQHLIFRKDKEISNTTRLLDTYAEWLESTSNYLEHRRMLALHIEAQEVPLGDARSPTFHLGDESKTRSTIDIYRAESSKLTHKLLLLEPDSSICRLLNSLAHLYLDTDTSYYEYVSQEVKFLDELENTRNTTSEIRDRSRKLYAKRLYP